MKLIPLFILADLEAGGAQRVILTILRHLNRKDFEPHLCIINSDGPMAKEIPENIHIHNLRGHRVRYALPAILYLCHRLRPDTVVTTIGHLNLYVLAARVLLSRHLRLIVREANTPSFRLQYTQHPFLYRLLYRKLYPLADCIVCNSEYMKRDMLNFLSLSPQKVAVIPNPVDLKRITHSLSESPNPYGTGKFQVVSVGRLHYQKGFDLLLKAMKKSLQKMSSLHLTVVGKGLEEKRLKKLTSDLGIEEHVSFVGHQDNPFPFMAYADLFVASSRWEGLPNAVLESLACGTPVLAFDCPGGTGEIIKDRGDWLVPFGDVDALGQRIVDVVESRKGMGSQADSLLPEAYRCESVVIKYEALLKGCRS